MEQNEYLIHQSIHIKSNHLQFLVNLGTSSKEINEIPSNFGTVQVATNGLFII